MSLPQPDSVFFFFNDTATTEIYTLSLHDALPISAAAASATSSPNVTQTENQIFSTTYETNTWSGNVFARDGDDRLDRKSTRLNSSHGYISYAVFCLKKKNRLILHLRHGQEMAVNL